MTVCTTGQFLADDLGDQIESIFGTPVTPVFGVGNQTTSCDGNAPADGQFDFLLNVPSLAAGIVEPENMGPVTFGIEDLQVGGTVIDGLVTLGGYQGGQWDSLLSGFFTFQTDANDPSDDNFADVRIEIDSERSSLTFDDNSASLAVVANAQVDAALGGEFGSISAGGNLGMNLTLEAQRTESFPFMEISAFDVSLGELSIDSIEVLFEDVIRLTANDITLHPDVNDPEVDPFGTIGSMNVEILAFQDDLGAPLMGLDLQQSSVEITDVTLLRDELRLSDVTFHLDGAFSAGDSTLIDVDDALLSFQNFVIPNPLAGSPHLLPNLSDLFQGDGVSTPRIRFDLDHAVLLPDGTGPATDMLCTPGATVGGLASVCGVSGRFDGNGTLELTADRMSANLADVLRVEAIDSKLRFGPSVMDETPLLEIGTAAVTMPLLRNDLTLTAVDLKLSRTGEVSVSGATLDAESDDPDMPNGVVASLGLGDFLPFDVTYVSIDSLDGSPIQLDDFANPNYKIGVDGYFDFSLFDDFPVKPVVRMDGARIQTEADRQQAANPFQLDFLVNASGVHIQETGFITLGFEDLRFGPLVAAADVTIGRYRDGQFEVGHLDGGAPAEGVLANIDVKWDQGDGALVEMAVGATIVGSLMRTLDSSDPSQWTTTLDLDGEFRGSLQLASDDTDDAWTFLLQNLVVAFGIELSVDEQLRFIENPGDAPVMTFDGLDVERTEIGLGEYMTLAATHVAVDFEALKGSVPGPFLTFGGQRPNRPPSTARNRFPPLDVDSVDGEIAVSFGGPLDGLGGSAGNFGIGFRLPDPTNQEFQFPIEFYQLPGFFVALQVPDDFNFGMPDWLPLSVTEIGLRFPDTFGDLLPFGDDESDEGGDGGFETIAKAGLDILSNFSLLFSGGLESTEGGWPLQGLVEDVVVNIDSLASCAEHVASQVDLDGLPYSSGLRGLSQAVRDQGLNAFTSISDCSFPIENLDAVDIGIEPFKIGPIEIGGGLGFGTLDIVDGDGNPAEVLFGRVEGQLAYSDIGIGAELIVTEYGPVLGRLFAGVPIPIGTLIGALAGSVVPVLGTGIGTSLGTQSGFILTGFQGGLKFDGQPLPVINEPLDLLTDPDIRFPLDVGFEEIRQAAQAAVQNETMTWNAGFTFAASGTLTNIHVYGLVGAQLTLGANIGFDAQQLLGLGESEPIPPDAFEYTDDTHQPCGQADLGVVPDLPVGFQLFGFGSLEVIGQSLVDMGVMFDYSDPVNPALYLAGSIPQPGSLLSLLVPGEATAGIQLCTDGLVEGAVVAMQTFVSRIIDDAGGLYHAILDDIAIDLQDNRNKLLSQLVLDTSGNRRIDAVENQQVITGRFLRDRLPTLLGADFGTAAEVAGELLNEFLSARPPSVISARMFLQSVIDSDGTRRQALAQIANQLQADRSDAFAKLVLNRDPTPVDISVGNVVVERRQFLSADESQQTIDLAFLTNRLQSLLGQDVDQGTALFVADRLLERIRSINAALAPDLSVQLPGDPNAPLNRLTASILASLMDTFDANGGQEILNAAGANPDPFDDSVAFNVQQALALAKAGVMRQIAYASQVVEIVAGTGHEAAEAFFDVIDPSLTFSAAVQPKLFGIEIGEPTDRVDFRVDKHQVHFDFHGSILSKIAAGIPITDTVDVFLDVPFDNLLRDLFIGQLPTIDADRDFHGGLGGTIGLAGIDLADFSGVIFPPVEGLQVPDDHTLNTHVQVADNNAVVGDKILVQPNDFATMKDYGGFLLDGRLTLPSLIIDPFAEISRLQQIQSSLVASLADTGCNTLWDCLIADPGAFFQAATQTSTVLGEEQQVAQLQLYLPGDANAVRNEFYVKGQYGTSPDANTVTSGKLLGVDLGGAFVSYQDGKFILEQDSPDVDVDPRNPDPEIRIELEDGPFGIPRAALEVNVDLSDSHASPLDALLTQLDIVGAGPNPGAWLDTGVFDVTGQVQVRAYTPGYESNPSGQYARLKRHGGVRLEASGSMAGYFGKITGDLEFDWTPADGFLGSFQGSAILDFPNLIGDLADIVGIESPDDLFRIPLATVNAQISESGCISIYVPQVAQDAQFSLSPGACDPAITIADTQVEEGATASVKIRISQLADDANGSAKVRYYLVDGQGSAGATGGEDFDFASGEITIPLNNLRTDEFGSNYVERDLRISTNADNSLEPDERFQVQIESVYISGTDTTLLDPRATVTIVDATEPPNYLAPGVPRYWSGDGFSKQPLVFFDFQTEFNFLERTADPRFDAFETTALTYFGRPIAGARGLADDTPNGATVGRAAEPANAQIAFGARPVYEFTMLPDENGHVAMIPQAVQFWDKPTGDQTWHVEVEVDSYPVEVFDVAELFTITEDFAPNIHPELIGWRRLQATINLQEPRQVFTLTTSPGYAGEVAVRIVPTGDYSPTRQIDNVALFGAADRAINYIDDLLIELESLLYGRLEFDITEGPGRFQAIVDVGDRGDVDPMIDSIVLVGSDATTVVEVSAEFPDGRLPGSVLELGNVLVDGPLGKFDTTAVGTVKGDFEFAGPVGQVHVDNVADGSSFQFAGDQRSTVSFLADGFVGGGGKGVDLSFEGRIDAQVGSWQGGQWDIGSAGTLAVTSGDFSPSLYVGEGIDVLEIRGGNLSSPEIRTGTRPGANGSTGQIIATADSLGNGGSILAGLIEIGGDIDSVHAEGGNFRAHLFADKVGSITTASDDNSNQSADLGGTVEADSIEVVSATGGDVTLSLVTNDVNHAGMSISASVDSQGIGGLIYSPHSFHIAGSVAEIIAESINVNLDVRGDVGSIMALAARDASGTQLVGRLSAGHFGEIVVTSGAADVVVEATSTDPGRPAIDSIRIPETEGILDRVRVIDSLNDSVGEIIDIDQDVSLKGDFDRDQRLTVRDVNLLCRGLRAGDVGFDANGDGVVDTRDLDEMIQTLLRTKAGDANLDGRFNSTDFVSIFQAGQYEDLTRSNSRWETGDWNCDGEFNTQDFVIAFQTGGYTAAARIGTGIGAGHRSVRKAAIAAAIEVHNVSPNPRTSKGEIPRASAVDAIFSVAQI